MKLLKKVFTKLSSSSLSFQKGEIVTTLTLIGLGVMLVGLFAGRQLAQQGTRMLPKAAAPSCYCSPGIPFISRKCTSSCDPTKIGTLCTTDEQCQELPCIDSGCLPTGRTCCSGSTSNPVCGGTGLECNAPLPCIDSGCLPTGRTCCSGSTSNPVCGGTGLDCSAAPPASCDCQQLGVNTYTCQGGCVNEGASCMGDATVCMEALPPGCPAVCGSDTECSPCGYAFTCDETLGMCIPPPLSCPATCINDASCLPCGTGFICDPGDWVCVVQALPPGGATNTPTPTPQTPAGSVWWCKDPCSAKACAACTWGGAGGVAGYPNRCTNCAPLPDGRMTCDMHCAAGACATHLDGGSCYDPAVPGALGHGGLPVAAYESEGRIKISWSDATDGDPLRIWMDPVGEVKLKGPEGNAYIVANVDHGQNNVIINADTNRDHTFLFGVEDKAGCTDPEFPQCSTTAIYYAGGVVMQVAPVNPKAGENIDFKVSYLDTAHKNGDVAYFDCIVPAGSPACTRNDMPASCTNQSVADPVFWWRKCTLTPGDYVWTHDWQASDGSGARRNKQVRFTVETVETAPVCTSWDTLWVNDCKLADWGDGVDPKASCRTPSKDVTLHLGTTAAKFKLVETTAGTNCSNLQIANYPDGAYPWRNVAGTIPYTITSAGLGNKKICAWVKSSSGLVSTTACGGLIQIVPPCTSWNNVKIGSCDYATFGDGSNPGTACITTANTAKLSISAANSPWMRFQNLNVSAPLSNPANNPPCTNLDDVQTGWSNGNTWVGYSSNVENWALTSGTGPKKVCGQFLTTYTDTSYSPAKDINVKSLTCGGMVQVNAVPTPTPTATPTGAPMPEFKDLSASLFADVAIHNFTYTGTASNYRVRISTVSDMGTDVYVGWGEGSGSPISVANPQQKWGKYTCGRTLYWRVYNADNLTIMSPIQTAVVNCSGVTNTPTPTATPTPTTVPGASCPPACANGYKRNMGDADCNGTVNENDFGIWLYQYMDSKRVDPLIPLVQRTANFNCTEGDAATYKVDMVDFAVWQSNYGKSNR